MNRLHFSDPVKAKLTDVSDHMAQPPDLRLVDVGPDRSQPLLRLLFKARTELVKVGGWGLEAPSLA